MFRGLSLPMNALSTPPGAAAMGMVGNAKFLFIFLFFHFLSSFLIFFFKEIFGVE